jgi:hypothetical protein
MRIVILILFVDDARHSGASGIVSDNCHGYGEWNHAVQCDRSRDE